MSSANSIRVATIHVDTAFEMSRESESAAAYHTIRVEPGAYPVESRVTRYGDRCIVAEFSGVCVHSGYGAKRYHGEEGKPSTVTRQPYKYELRSGRYQGLRVEIHNDAAMDAAYGV